MGWLSGVLAQAQKEKWCVRATCTTCAAMEFRRAYWSGARDAAGVLVSIETARRPGEILRHAALEDREAIIKALMIALSVLDAVEAETQAVATILSDLDPPLLRFGVPVSLDELLDGTAVGVRLAGMRARSAAIQAKRAEREEFESPHAVAVRAERRRAATEARVAYRQREKALRDAERNALLADLKRLGSADRLRRYAWDGSLNLDWVPDELIPNEKVALEQLEGNAVRRLVDRIDRRRGAWGKLRRRLLGALAAG